MSSQDQEFKGREYLLESDAEGARLRDQHDMFKAANGDKLILAPIDLTTPHLRILDVGTYDGTFLLDLYSNFLPENVRNTDTLVGVDVLNAHFPTSTNNPTGSNFKFQTQNIREPWPKELLGSFDLVHQRLMLAGAGADTQANLNQTMKLVKPGGWIQLMEAEQTIGSHDGPAMHDFITLMGEFFAFMRVPMTYAHNLPTWLEEAGFEDVQTMIVPIVYGVRQADETLRVKSLNSMKMALKGILGHVKMIPGGVKGLSETDMETLIPRLMEELGVRGGEYSMRYAWGRKPGSVQVAE